MSIPPSHREDFDKLPPVLRTLLEAELAAGNEIADVGHTFPAPPVGAYFLLARPVTSRPRASGDGMVFRDYGSSLYSGGFTDATGFFHILEAPLPPPPEPDMDAIRAAHATSSVASRRRSTAPPDATIAPHNSAAQPSEATLLSRFRQSMQIDYEKWREGIGYDLEQIALASPDERQAIEGLLLNHTPRGWRDVEGLAALNTERARQALRETLEDGDAELLMAVLRFAPEIATAAERAGSIVRAVETAAPYEGLSETLDQIADFHPPEVIDAMFRGTLTREGEVACHLAAMLMFVHGKARDPFDWDQRPFFLRFNTKDRFERETAFRELCQKLGAEPGKYFSSPR